MKLLPLVFLLTSWGALALPEDDLSRDWHKKALPFFQNLSEGNFQNAQGMTLVYRQSSELMHKKSLVVIPGFSEPALKYAEVLYDFQDEYNLFILDHQDHGDSGRWLKDPQKSHVWQFNDYVNDLAQWVKEFVLPQTQGQELYILAHSMGGAVVIKYLATHPGIFKKATLNAPMLEVYTDPYSERVALLLSWFLVKTGKGQQYAPTRGPYIPEEDTFESNILTHSQARFDVYKYINTTWPHLVKGGPTTRWGHENIKMTKTGYKSGKKITIPLLMFQAGLDEIVKPSRQDHFCQLAPQCEKVLFPGAHHEILMEKDEMRDAAMRRIRTFLR